MTGIPDAVRIVDPADPRIQAYMSLRERDLRGHGDRFVAEGEVVLRVLLGQARFAVESLLVAESRLEALGALLAARPRSAPLYAAGQSVMDAVVGFHIHRGILAIGKRIEAPRAYDLLATLGPHALVVVLAGIANHDNVGGIFRNAAAFGADAVLMDRASCDPLYRKAIRVSVGAALLTPFAWVATPEEALGLLRDEGFDCLALSPSADETLAETGRTGRVAVFLGSEGTGLPETVLAGARRVRIEMAGRLDSLNVATASGIALHHLHRS